MDNDGTHITFEFVKSHLNSSGQFFGYVAEGETAWNPASTKRPIYGPAKVDYTLFPDGGWHCRLDELGPDPAAE